MANFAIATLVLYLVGYATGLASPTPAVQRPDIVVIGGGSAGLTAAKFAARFGKEVVLVEKGKLGGDCTWTGCVPSKALIASAKQAHAVRTAASYGILVGGGREPQVTTDWAALKARLQRTIEHIYDEDDSPKALEKLGITVVKGTASFQSPDGTVVIETSPSPASASAHAASSSPMVITPKYGTVVATGAQPIIPASLAAAAAGRRNSKVPSDDDGEQGGSNLFLTYEDVFEMSTQPSSMTIIGGGPIGCELAQAFQRLGTQVGCYALCDCWSGRNTT